MEDDDFQTSSSFFVGGQSSSKGAFLRDGNEYEPPFGLRSVESISVRRLNVLDSFYREEEEDDDDDDVVDDDDGETREESANRDNGKGKEVLAKGGFKNIASQLNSIEVYFTLKRIVKDSSVFSARSLLRIRFERATTN